MKNITPEMKANFEKISPPALGARRVAGNVASKALKGTADRYKKSLEDYLEKNKNYTFKSKAPNAILRKLMK